MKRLRWLIVAAACALAVAMTAGPAAGVSGGGTLTASDVGITPTEIRIGVVADTGSTLAPGLFQGAVDGVEAWADYMNVKENGLAGRKIVIDTYDSKLTADDARNSIIEACSKDFATVGTAALFLNNVDDLVSCKDSKGAATGMPDFPTVVTEVVQQCSPVSWSINPPPLDCATKDQHPQTYHGSLGGTNYYLKKFGKNALHGVFLYPSDVKAAKNAQVPAFTAQQKAGIKPDANFDVSALAPQSAYTPYVQQIKDKSSTYARSGLNDAGYLALRKEAKLQGVNSVKVWDCSVQCYDKDFVSSANSADTEGQYVWFNFIPFEEVSTSKAEQNFIQYLGRDKADGFSLQAYASGLFLRDVINSVIKTGGNDAVTRKAVLEAAPKITAFTADGMLGTTNVGQRLPSPCIVVTQVKGGKFVRVFPTKKGTLDCNPKNVYSIKMDLS